MADANAVDARALVSQRRDEREEAYHICPREWVGTATEAALAFPYNTLWGFPEKFHREPPKKTGEIKCTFSGDVKGGRCKVTTKPFGRDPARLTRAQDLTAW
jgi:hypothetical protein